MEIASEQPIPGGSPPGQATQALLDPAEVRALARVSDLRGAVDLALVWGVILLAMAAADRSGSWLVGGLALVVIGSRQNALATLAHEAWHRLAFSNASVNHAIGAWAYAYPIGIPYFHDRRRHLRHHREVGLAHDPDWINYTSEGRETPLRVLAYLASLLCGRLVLGTAWNLLVRRQPRIAVDEPESRARSSGPTVSGELLRIAILQGLLFAFFWAAFSWWTYPVFWALPVATVGGFFANFRAFLEHASASGSASPSERLRDFEVGPLEAFFFSPCHFHYHALHHAYVAIPHRNLPRAKRLILEKHPRYPLEVQRGYLASLFTHLGALRRGS